MPHRTFGALGVADDLVAVLAESGIRSPFPIQSLTIPDALAGRDVLGKAQTGSGKTLAFGLPMVERIGHARPGHPTGLVLVPTRELAKQVQEAIEPLAEARSLRVVPLYGGTDVARNLKDLRKGIDLVVATPGRLIDLIQQDVVFLDEVVVAVVDEADRMNDMGFKPQVEWVLRRTRSERQTLLFSATLDNAVDSLVRRFLRDPVHYEVDAEQPTVEAMQHRFIAVHQLDKPKLTAAITAAHDRVLIFVRTKRGAERLAEQLQREGVKADAIHGDRTQAQRERALEAFSDGRLPALVATDVAARGIHVESVDVVVHYDPAEDDKDYLHRSGRTARAGDSGLAVTLVLWNQMTITERLMRRLGLSQPIVEMLSNDPRLADLVSWDPEAEAVA